jgi:hypothetical protein
VVVHEGAHHLEAGHAKLWSCPSGNRADYLCEYGDAYSIMGRGQKTLAAHNREHNGWLSATSIRDVSAAACAGTYTIAEAITASRTDQLAVRIARVNAALNSPANGIVNEQRAYLSIEYVEGAVLVRATTKGNDMTTGSYLLAELKAVGAVYDADYTGDGVIVRVRSLARGTAEVVVERRA